ncbi:MAG: hypothetical protein QOD63_1970, partial [Actinomycetota bacterium]|nr:hypothetical protein [Actinomycetota bacterium]
DELPAGAVGELPPADDTAPTDPLRATGDTATATGDPAGDQSPPGRSDAGNEV